MKKLRHFFRSRLSSGEAGQALILVLIFLTLGSLTLVPTLTHISTALKTGEVYEQNTNELYTADAGIEDSLWRIKYDFMGSGYNPYDFETAWPYQTDGLNGMTANFTISNVWFPTNVSITDPYDPGFIDLTADEARQMIDSKKLVVAGSALPGQPYRVLVDFNPDVGDNLTVKSIGVWLPRGFNYTGNCTLQAVGQPRKPDQVTSTEAPGGWTVVWSYDAPYPYLDEFPNFDADEMTFYFTFSYTPPADHPTMLPSAVAWITTKMLKFGVPQPPTPENVPVSWDVDTHYYKMVSEAGDTQIEAYSSKNDLRQLGDAMSGDYVAIGNSLLSDDDGDDKRDDWHTPGSFNLTSIPANADAVYAFLYWSGWRNEDAIQDVFSDDCTDFNEWHRTDDDLYSQTRYPASDISHSGTWDQTTNMYTYVDEAVSDGDTTYLKHGTTAGSALFGLNQAFNVPAGSTIQDLTVTLVARDDPNGDNRMQPTLKVGGNNYLTTSTSQQVPNSYGTISYVYQYNPRRTGSSPWTVDDINGIGTYALQGFGVNSADANPQIRLTQVYAQVNYYTPSLWTISSGEFQGQGSTSTSNDIRTMTLKTSENLSSYGAGIFNISWDQRESGSLSSNDKLYFALSGDGGSTWSPNYEAFSGNDPESPFTYRIPDDYVTSHNFMMRFYFNFNSSSEYVYLDNIRIVYLPVDTGITFKIGNDQVYFNGSEPAVGPHDLTAGRSYAMLDTMWGDPYGFSYACVRDVSALVNKYPVHEGEEHHTGNANYTVDGITAETRNPNGSLSDFAFAGWSLIIVYACPETAGHYIYIRDNNFAFHPGTGGNLDFDADGNPGGTITDFIIPNPITDKYGHIIETVAAKLTCFVVEGDDFTNDTSSIVVTGKNGHSKSLTNPSCELNDVWNGKSYPGTFKEGVDVDTFELAWTDGVVSPGDDQLQVDLYSLNDAWNLVYFIISIRSETHTSGTGYYTIRGG